MNRTQNILLTGGAGYNGSHTYIAMQAAGLRSEILDDFSNSYEGVLARLAHITGRPVVCERGNVADTALVESVLKKHAAVAVVHFAEFKAVGECVAQPFIHCVTCVPTPGFGSRATRPVMPRCEPPRRLASIS